MNRTARTVLYTLSGGALSALFTFAGTSQAEAAPPPPPKPAPSPAHGTEEKKIAQKQKAAARKPSPAHGIEEKKVVRKQKAAAPKPPVPAKPQTAPKPKPVPKPSPAHGTEEKKIARKQKAAAPKPPSPAKPQLAPKPSPAHGTEEKKIARKQKAAAPKPQTAPKPKPAPKPSPAHGTEEKKIAQKQKAAARKPSPAHGTEEKKIAQKQKGTTRVAQQPAPAPSNEKRRADEARARIERANPKTPPKPSPVGLRATEVKHGVPTEGVQERQARPKELPQSLRLAEAAAERQAETERQFDLHRQTSRVVKPARTDGVLERTAPGRSAYAASQQGGAPGTGLRRQAGQARDEADRLAGVRDRSRTTSLFEQEQNRRLATEADAKAKGLEGKVFDDHLHAQLAKSARQGEAGRYPLLKPVPDAPRPPISRPGRGSGELPQSLRLAEAAAERQAQTERQFDLHRQTSRVVKPARTDGVLERTAPGRSAYAASQQGGASGSGLRRQADQARDEADRLAGVRDRSRTAPPAEQERNRRLAEEAKAKADGLGYREFVQQDLRKRAEADRTQQEHQDRLRREAESRNRPPQSWGLCVNGSATFMASGKNGGCLVLDSTGFGATYQETLGVEAGLGLSASATVQSSSATIENLNGPSVVTGASGVVGVGVEGSVGVSADGSNNWSASVGPAVGGEASVGIGGQYTNAVRLGDYGDLLSLLTGPALFR
ncbi:hypothetical protein [Umezawaea sp. Da 62-37]|uniref:hypothetical protein n=1 Tax=Umezawaea sp. Da 62-37 TaxID=3075927 RepID=UPI0028F7266A|nr:hypothetical protein [Umezawaea sp. Da 62-37]WNV87791.1 hypothetical protein RM788_05770 [Umezawaea sp. Da 62-37]